uniref:F-box protein SKIP24-like n=1 Tax=Fragaria vesca subsp. vesca TaxID=101020 RepID=UPI0005C8D660|nr:PREDICTED: F-box protein SKIP24-like [Fragaria vesca subsp. vesca]
MVCLLISNGCVNYHKQLRRWKWPPFNLPEAGEGCEDMMMLVIPDKLWRRVLEIGGLSYKDLCCVSITCWRIHRLSDEDLLWSRILSSDFPPHSSSSSSSKSLYKLRFERDRDKRKVTHQRAVLRKESQIIEHSRKLRDMETRLAQETDRMRATLVELSNFHKVRQASSLALNNVWQREITRGRQKQIVEQCVVPAESRHHALEMELRLCKMLISGLEKACKDEKRRLGLVEQELQPMRYHPLRDQKPLIPGDAQCTGKSKKLKRFHGQGKKITSW